jgi:hypothetical protein
VVPEELQIDAHVDFRHLALPVLFPGFCALASQKKVYHYIKALLICSAAPSDLLEDHTPPLNVRSLLPVRSTNAQGTVISESSFSKMHPNRRLHMAAGLSPRLAGCNPTRQVRRMGQKVALGLLDDDLEPGRFAFSHNISEGISMY